MLARLLPNGRAEEIPGAVQTFSIKAHGAPAQPTMVFRLYYTEEVNTNSGVFYLWLDTSSNLQRLNLDGLPYNLDVEIVTPTPIVSGQRHCQMNRLVEAAHQTHMNFLADWFPLDENEPLVQFRAHRGLRASRIGGHIVCLYNV